MEENVQFDSSMDSFPEPTNNIGELHNYQVSYEALDGDDKTELVAATQVITEGDMCEFWYGDVLAFAINKETLLQVRNVSLMLPTEDKK